MYGIRDVKTSAHKIFFGGKRNKMSGMIAVVALLLIGAMSFIACPTDAGDGDKGTPTPPPPPPPETSVYKSIYSGETADGVESTPWDGNVDTETVDGRTSGKAFAFTSTASWGGFSFQTDEFLDFAAYDALSYWVKSPDGAVIETGFAGDNANAAGWEVKYKGNDNTGLVVGTEWQRVIVPVPAIQTPELKQSIFVLGEGLFGKTVHIDDIELIKTSKTLKSITIPAGEPIAQYPAETEISSVISGIKAVYTVDGVDVTLYGESLFSKWYTPEYDVTGDATLSADSSKVVPEEGGNAFALTVSFGGKTGTLNGTISETAFVSLGDFSGRTGDLNDTVDNVPGPNATAGYWAAGDSWAAFQVKGGRNAACFINGTNYCGIGRSNQTWDISELTSVSLLMYADSDDTSIIGTTYRFGVDVGDPDNGGTTYFYDITTTEAMNKSWVKVTIPLSNFKDEGNNALSSNTINGWRVVRPVANAGGLIALADIIVSE